MWLKAPTGSLARCRGRFCISGVAPGGEHLLQRGDRIPDGDEAGHLGLGDVERLGHLISWSVADWRQPLTAPSS